MRNSKYKDDTTPIDANSDCPASRDYSKAYLRHLVMSNEILGSTLLTWHNLHYYQDIMRGLRGL